MNQKITESETHFRSGRVRVALGSGAGLSVELEICTSEGISGLGQIHFPDFILFLAFPWGVMRRGRSGGGGGY